jgi:alpha-1,2-mannosyltransferase
MRTVLTGILVAALAVGTALSVTLLPFYDEKKGDLAPIVYITAALWVAFALAVVALRAVPARASIILIITGSIAISGAAMFGPPNTSTDSARYAWDGIVQNAGYSPYDYVPADPALEELRPEWLFPEPVVGADGELECVGSRILTSKEVGTGDILCTALNRAPVPTIYPPTSELVFAGVRALVDDDAQYWPMQALGALLSIAMTALLVRELRRREMNVRWAALWAWCPLVATEGVTNSHIDMVGAVLLVVATILVSQGRRWRGGIALGAAIAAKLIPVIGAPALLKGQGWKVIVGSIAAFALLYVPYIIASGPSVLGYLPGYLSEEGYESGNRFVLFSWFADGLAGVIIVGIIVVATGILVWRRTDPTNPWLGQTLMIGVVLMAVTPRYPWYALLLVPMVAMSGRWEWLAVPLALTARLLVPTVEVARWSMIAAILIVACVTFYRLRSQSVTGIEGDSAPPRLVTKR